MVRASSVRAVPRQHMHRITSARSCSCSQAERTFRKPSTHVDIPVSVRLPPRALNHPCPDVPVHVGVMVSHLLRLLKRQAGYRQEDHPLAWCRIIVESTTPVSAALGAVQAAIEISTSDRRNANSSFCTAAGSSVRECNALTAKIGLVSNVYSV